MPHHGKLLSHLVLVLLLISAFPLITQLSTNVSATALNCTWKPTSGVLASTAANWENGSAPATGDNIYFISSWITSCTYDITTSVGAFNIRTGYSGTITQAASFSVTGYSQAAGTFTGSASYTLTDSGNFVRTGGTLTILVLRLIMQTDGTTITLGTDEWYFYQLTINGNVTLTNSFTGTWNANSGIWIANGKTLTISTGKTLGWFTRGTWSNLGTITGGSILFRFYDADLTAFVLGIVNSAVIFQATSDATASRSCTLGANAVFGNILTINSLHGTYTMTPALNGYSLSAAGITIGTRGIITAGASVITCSGNWDSSAGTFTAGTSSLVMSGTTKTIKTANTNGAPYNLTISGTVSTLSSLNVTNNLTIDSGKTLILGSGKTLGVSNDIINNGAIYQTGNVISITGASPRPLKGYGTFDGNLYLNSTPVILYADIGSSMPSYLHSNKQTRLTAASGQYLEFAPDGSQDVNITGLNFGSSISWIATSTGQVTFTVSGLVNEMRYYIVIDGDREYQLKSNDAGQLTLTYSGPWSEHTFALEKYNLWGPINDLSSSFLYLTAIICLVMLLLLVVERMKSRGGKNGN